MRRVIGFACQGIFDSLQGAANCVIFCLFTKAVRNRIAACICSYCPRSSHHSRQQRGVNVNQSHRVVTSEYCKLINELFVSYILTRY